MSRRLVSSAVLLLPLLVAPATADTVTLRNGRAFRDVVADVKGGEVTIAIPGGELRLPMAQVASVDAGPAPLREYQARRDALRHGRGTTATDWLELARWAKGYGLDGAAREAALQAAALDPQLAGLSPMLIALGLVRDSTSGAWIDPDEAMRRRGLVLDNGAWVEPQEQARRDETRARLALAREQVAAQYAPAGDPDGDAWGGQSSDGGGIAAQPVWGGGGVVWPWGVAFVPPHRPLRPPVPRPIVAPRPQPTPVASSRPTSHMALAPGRRVGP